MKVQDYKDIKINNINTKKTLHQGSIIWKKGTPISDFPIGTKVIDSDTKYDGKPIVWIVADKNHAGYPTNSVTLVMYDVIKDKTFDAFEPKSIDYYRRIAGNNRYKFSNILQWLNSDHVNWYKPMHSTDMPPDAGYTEHKPYTNEAGFLTNFSNNFKNQLLITSVNVQIPKLDGGGVERIERKIHLMSPTELGVFELGYKEGIRIPELISSEKTFPIFTDNKSRIAGRSYFTTGGDYYFLRTPQEGESCILYAIANDGKLWTNSPSNKWYHIRIMCNVKADADLFETL